jgi:pleiotropic regulator 1
LAIASEDLKKGEGEKAKEGSKDNQQLSLICAIGQNRSSIALRYKKEVT